MSVPNLPERTEWNLAGQRVPIRLPLTSSVGQLKQKLSQALGMQPAKQKLHLDVRHILFIHTHTHTFLYIKSITIINCISGSFLQRFKQLGIL